MKPLVSYYGGKQRILSKILPLVEAIPHSLYAEPFCGGASLLFAKPIPQSSNSDKYKEIINDNNQQLINLYRIAVTKPDELELMIKATLMSQADYKRSHAIYTNPQDYDPITQAWATYMQCNQSFGNKISGGWDISCARNKAATWNNKKNCLKETLERIDKVCMSCEDGLKFIERFDRPYTLFYCDPPYPNTNQGHYKGYTMKDYENLCDLLDNIKGSYILSNYPQEKKPKSAQEEIRVKSNMSVTRDKSLPKERTEVLYVCHR